jgi:hypothetical protein
MQIALITSSATAQLGGFVAVNYSSLRVVIFDHSWASNAELIHLFDPLRERFHIFYGKRG